MATFRERLQEAARKHESWLCVGLDPPPGAPQDVETILARVIEATGDLACCFKPNAAFFEAMGDAGHGMLARTIRLAQRHAPVILDAKRGDIGNTADAYATASFDVLGADAVTVAPYMGRDSVEPFARRVDRGVFVLARTSNPGAADLQSERLASGELVYEHVARLATSTWSPHGNVGLVAGATAPAELARVRAIAGPDTLLLIPGVGAQGGTPEDAMRCGANSSGENAIVNASRAILQAPDAREAARKLRDALNAAV